MMLPINDRGHASTDNEICLHERYAPTTFQDSFTHFFYLEKCLLTGLNPCLFQPPSPQIKYRSKDRVTRPLGHPDPMTVDKLYKVELIHKQNYSHFSNKLTSTGDIFQHQENFIP